MQLIPQLYKHYKASDAARLPQLYAGHVHGFCRVDASAARVWLGLTASVAVLAVGSSPRPILRIAIQNYGRVLVNYLEIFISFLICPLI